MIKDLAAPCNDMFITLAWNWQILDNAGKSDEIQIKFDYQEQYYQELRYRPDFDVETFISSIGGFVLSLIHI